VKKKRRTLEDDERALRDADPRTGGEAFREALRSRHSQVVARAARLIRQHAVEGCEAELEAAFRRLLDDPVKSDPTCAAKIACIEALDYGESSHEEIFLVAARLVQLEPAWGPPVDTAVPVRARGLFALARLGHDELELVVAELLTDQEVGVRQAALEALLHRGAKTGAALALYKLRLGDADPMVELAAMNALLGLAPEWGLRELAPLLSGDEERAELAALALGQSKSDAALRLLTVALEQCVQQKERRPIYRGLGLHRSDGALEVLLRVIADSPLADAREAIEALAARRYDPGVADKVRRAGDRPELQAALAEHFSA
jgi:hypothetical protein